MFMVLSKLGLRYKVFIFSISVIVLFSNAVRLNSIVLEKSVVINNSDSVQINSFNEFPFGDFNTLSKRKSPNDNTTKNVLYNTNFFAAFMTDTDGDGINDEDDLDDDNDGISDIEENGCADDAEIRWLHNDDGGQSDNATFNPTTASTFYTSSSLVTFGMGLDESDNSTFTYTLRGADQANFADAKTNNDYAQVSFTPAVDLLFQELNFGFFTLNAAAEDFNMGNFQVAVEYATDATFTSPTILIQDLQIGDMIAGASANFSQNFDSFVLNSGTEYFWRIYFYDEQNTDPFGRVRLDDVFFNSSVSSTCNDEMEH